MKVAMAQINPIVGDIKYNAKRILQYMEKGEKWGAKLVIFPELALTGYPPKDLLLRNDFLAAVAETIKKEIMPKAQEVAVLLGTPVQEEDGFERELVLQVIEKVDAAEYKRRQAPPGLRVTSRAFGTGRRMPIAQRW